MNEMVERVAKAIRGTITKDEWNEIGENTREVYRMAARNAIQAMHSPTLAMLDTADAIEPRDTVQEIWSVMIDAALRD